VKDFAAALDICEQVLMFGGRGHTCGIYSNDEAKVRQYGLRMPAFRVLVNTPTPSGSTGLTTNLQPSMTLGCGAVGGNVTSDNVGPQHLMNVKRIAYWVRSADQAIHAPEYTGAAKACAPAMVPSSSGIDRQTVVAAVEKYLSQRGISLTSAPAVAPAPPPPPPAPAPAPVTASTVANVAAGVVDRFLSSKYSVGKGSSDPACNSCGCGGKSSAAPEAGSCGFKPKAEENPLPPAPKITIVDFVAEADVRQAITHQKKIYIGPKTIVTPAARELANANDTLVMAQR
jgi:acetaldehyde dehydrogenase (acetylating)